MLGGDDEAVMDRQHWYSFVGEIQHDLLCQMAIDVLEAQALTSIKGVFDGVMFFEDALAKLAPR
jgi:hypothetical protein